MRPGLLFCILKLARGQIPFRIAARNTTKAKIIAKDLGGEAVTIDSLMANAFPPADIIVNATSVSSHHRGPGLCRDDLENDRPEL